MGWWVAKPTLGGVEKIQASWGANRQQTATRQVGGRLTLTNQRLLFVPNRVDALTGGRRWSVFLTQIRGVGDVPPVFTLAVSAKAAQNRRRLRVEQTSGEVDAFVVNRVNGVIERINAALPDTRDWGR